jgi:hypothetical protein
MTRQEVEESTIAATYPILMNRRARTIDVLATVPATMNGVRYASIGLVYRIDHGNLIASSRSKTDLVVLDPAIRTGRSILRTRHLEK